MKQITKFMTIAALAAALVSCVKEIEKPVVEATDGIQVTLTATAPVTKTYVEGVNPFWKGTDAIGVFTGSDGTNAQFTNTLPDGKKGSFTGTVPAIGTYYAYYPFSQIYGANNTGVSCQFPEEQRPTPTSFDGAADFLVSEAFEVTSTEAQTLDKLVFTRLGAFLKFQFIDGTTGGRLADEYVTEVKVIVNLNVDGDYRPCPSFRITPEGIGTVGGGMKTIKAVYDENVYQLTAEGNAAWFGIRPHTFAAGNTFDVTLTTSNYIISKTLTLPSEIAVGAGDVLPINVTLTDSDAPEKVLTIERVWGKYSSNSAYWNESFGGTPSTDRNIAMDESFIYLPETTGSAKMWMIPVDGTTAPSLVNVEGVSGGTHALSCVRMIPNTSSSVNGGKPFLMAVSLTTDDGSTPMKVYSWASGPDAAPLATSVSTWCGRRLGDKFTVYGSLQDGGLFFKDWNNASSQGAFLVLRTAWSVAPTDGYFNPRRTNMVSETGIAAYYPYPGDPQNGLYAHVSNKSYYASFSSNPLSTNPNESGTFTDAGGYYSNTAGFNFFTFNGKKYIAYVKNADGGDGRFYVMEGESTDSWKDLLGSKRKVIYQADIQQDLAFSDGDYHEELASGVTKTSANSCLDCTIYETADAVYIAAHKQGVGLSLFKMSLK